MKYVEEIMRDISREIGVTTFSEMDKNIILGAVRCVSHKPLWYKATEKVPPRCPAGYSWSREVWATQNTVQIFSAFYDHNSGRWYDYTTREPRAVTHWMPRRELAGSLLLTQEEEQQILKAAGIIQ